MYLWAALGRRKPIPIKLDNLRYIPTEARSHYLSSADSALCLTAAALVVSGTATARFLASFAARSSGTRLPVQVFADEQTALSWLMQHLEAGTGSQSNPS